MFKLLWGFSLSRICMTGLLYLLKLLVFERNKHFWNLFPYLQKPPLPSKIPAYAPEGWGHIYISDNNLFLDLLNTCSEIFLAPCNFWSSSPLTINTLGVWEEFFYCRLNSMGKDFWQALLVYQVSVKQLAIHDNHLYIRALQRCWSLL